MQDARAHLAGTAAHRRGVEPQLAAEILQIAALSPRGERVDLLEYAPLHLLGGLVGEGHGEDVAVALGVFHRVAHVFVGQLVGLSRPRARIEDSRSHARRFRLVRNKSTKQIANDKERLAGFS